MDFKIQTRFEQMTLAISVQTKGTTKVRLRVIDADKPLTVFTDRYKTVSN